MDVASTLAISSLPLSPLLSSLSSLSLILCFTVISVMASDNSLGDAGKAEEVGASIQGAVLEPAVAPAHGISQTCSSHSEETEAAHDDARDLEQLAVVSTGPVYSAFSTAQKRFIVVMVSSIFLFQLALLGTLTLETNL